MKRSPSRQSLLLRRHEGTAFYLIGLKFGETQSGSRLPRRLSRNPQILPLEFLNTATHRRGCDSD